MHSLKIENEEIFFRDIKKEDLPFILERYNNTKEFRFATGIDAPIQIDRLIEKYVEAQICSSEIFSAICLKRTGKMVGLIKGLIHYKGSDTAWISSLMIDPEHRRQGIGSKALEAFIKHISEEKNITRILLSVAEENESGLAFWLKHGFEKVRYMNSHIMIDGKQQNIIIMNKNIGKSVFINGNIR